MKRLLALLLTAALLLSLGACARAPRAEEMEQPVKFYYRTALEGEDAYGTDTGALAWEWRDLGAEQLPPSKILELYLRGPESEELQSPFLEGTAVSRLWLNEGLLMVELNEKLDELPGVDRTLAVAALVYTMTQFGDIRSVQVVTENWHSVLDREDFLLVDDAHASDQVAVKLYFGAEEGPYLTEELRRSQFQSENQIPAYVVRALLEGPREPGHRRVLPENVRLLGLNVEEKLCIVNLSEEFLRAEPENHWEARQAVFSLVNSLTELSRIEQVLLLCQGNSVGSYGGLDLSEPLIREENMFLEEGANMEDVVLYLPSGREEQLMGIPIQIRRIPGASLAQDTLTELLSFESRNGYNNPIPEGVVAMDVRFDQDLCRVTFNSAFALCDAVPEQAEQAVRAVVCTLCSLERVERVQIQIHDGKMKQVDLSQPIRPLSSWYHP